MLAGLMSRWTMPSRVRGIERVGDLNAERQHSLQFERPPGDAVLQSHPVKKFHGDERLAILLANIVNGADVGMIQRGSRLGLALKTSQGLRIAGNLVRQEFQGDEAVQAACLRPCKRRPCRRHRVSRGCGNARWFGRSFVANLTWQRVGSQ